MLRVVKVHWGCARPGGWLGAIRMTSSRRPRSRLRKRRPGHDVWHRRRLSMKPGITGLWQVEARHEPEFDRWVERDLAYIDRWSLLLDLKILLRTVPAVLPHGEVARQGPQAGRGYGAPKIA
jgi:Bacterial sugar transferase